MAACLSYSMHSQPSVQAMCGRLNVTDDPSVIALFEMLGIPLFPDGYEPPTLLDPDGEPVRFGRFIRATSKVSIVREKEGKRTMQSAIWWLLLESTEDGFKPSAYTSFNTRHDKLNTPRSAGYQAYRQSRCVIPVMGFGETQGKGSNAQYTDFEGIDQAIALGGLCREWVHKATGQIALSCSVITLPPHERLKPYHNKSMPLILPQHDNTLDMWLDRSMTDTAIFDDLLNPNLPQALQATPIDKPSTYNAVSESERIEPERLKNQK